MIYNDFARITIVGLAAWLAVAGAPLALCIAVAVLAGVKMKVERR